MPKCLNDPNKTFSGKEPSPKGLGYSASAESKGKTMHGKDENMWEVVETKTCKKWMRVKTPKKVELDFDNLSDKFYTNAYIPITTQIKFEEETGLEDKFGGNKPFFIKGETWPIDKLEIPMKFFGQFKDPQKDDKILFRIFIAIDNDSDQLIENYSINKIELNEENIQNQIVIKNTFLEDIRNMDKYTDEDSDEDSDEYIFLPYKITHWEIKKELKFLRYITAHFNINEDSDEFSNIYFDKYFESKYCPSSGIKVWGTPIFTQYKIRDPIFKSFFQITQSKELPYEWGDSGIAHIYENFILDWDCY